MPILSQVKKTCHQKEHPCNKQAKRHGPIMGHLNRPVVLSQNRYNLLKERSDKDSGQKTIEEKRAERETLDALTKSLTVNIQITPEQKLAEVKRLAEEKDMKARLALESSQAIYEELRRQKIVNAENLIQKLKPGPRSLTKAAKQSEMFRAREIQQEVNQLIQESIKKQEMADKASCQLQSIFYVGEQKDRMQEHAAKEKAYRQEIVKAIKDKECMRHKAKMQKLEEERQERAKIDAEIKAQIEKERQVIEKKRHILLNNAIEAMKMAEERKKREAMYDEIEDRLCCVFNVGHRELEKLKAAQAKEFAVERQKKIERNTEILAKIQEQIRDTEAERIRRDISTMKLKFDDEEQVKRNREKELKKQRIEAHLKEMEQIRLAEERNDEARRFEVAQRFKNSEVNAKFAEADRLQQQQRAKCVRAQLMAQEEERQRITRERDTKVCSYDKKSYEKEDNFFFKYAHTLMEDAKKKQRSLYPFKKAINDYKHANMCDMERSKLPRHLVSSVCHNYDKDKDEEYAEARTCILPKEICKSAEKKTMPLSKVEAETLEHMAKVDAMLVEDELHRSEKSKSSCVPGACITSFEKQQQTEKKDGLQSNKSSATMRYGIEELKNLASPIPSQHCCSFIR